MTCCAECQTRPNDVRRHDHAGSHRDSNAGIRCSAKGCSRVLDQCRTKTTCISCANTAAGTGTVIVDAAFAKQRHWIRKTVLTGTRSVCGARRLLRLRAIFRSLMPKVENEHAQDRDHTGKHATQPHRRGGSRDGFMTLPRAAPTRITT